MPDCVRISSVHSGLRLPPSHRLEYSNIPKFNKNKYSLAATSNASASVFQAFPPYPDESHLPASYASSIAAYKSPDCQSAAKKLYHFISSAGKPCMCRVWNTCSITSCASISPSPYPLPVEFKYQTISFCTVVSNKAVRFQCKIPASVKKFVE